MKGYTILILNWRDPMHPLSGGAEQMILEHAKYWKKSGAHIKWFASGFRKGKQREVIEGIEIIRRGSHFTVSVWAFIYYITGNFGTVDLVVDCFHFFPFFTPIYMKKVRKIAVIHEIAGSLWAEPCVMAKPGADIATNTLASVATMRDISLRLMTSNIVPCIEWSQVGACVLSRTFRCGTSCSPSHARNAHAEQLHRVEEHQDVRSEVN